MIKNNTHYVKLIHRSELYSLMSQLGRAITGGISGYRNIKLINIIKDINNILINGLPNDETSVRIIGHLLKTKGKCDIDEVVNTHPELISDSDLSRRFINLLTILNEENIDELSLSIMEALEPGKGDIDIRSYLSKEQIDKTYETSVIDRGKYSSLLKTWKNEVSLGNISDAVDLCVKLTDMRHKYSILISQEKDLNSIYDTYLRDTCTSDLKVTVDADGKLGKNTQKMVERMIFRISSLQIGTKILNGNYRELFGTTYRSSMITNLHKMYDDAVYGIDCMNSLTGDSTQLVRRVRHISNLYIMVNNNRDKRELIDPNEVVCRMRTVLNSADKRIANYPIKSLTSSVTSTHTIGTPKYLDTAELIANINKNVKWTKYRAAPLDRGTYSTDMVSDLISAMAENPDVVSMFNELYNVINTPENITNKSVWGNIPSVILYNGILFMARDMLGKLIVHDIEPGDGIKGRGSVYLDGYDYTAINLSLTPKLRIEMLTELLSLIKRSVGLYDVMVSTGTANNLTKLLTDTYYSIKEVSDVMTCRWSKLTDYEKFTDTKNELDSFVDIIERNITKLKEELYKA